MGDYIQGKDGRMQGSHPSGRVAKLAMLRARVASAHAALEQSRQEAAAKKQAGIRKLAEAVRRQKEKTAQLPSKLPHDLTRGGQLPMRAESFAHLRAGGAVHGGGVRVAVYPDGKVGVIDGRHRITLAREAGQTHILGEVITYGPRGGTKSHQKNVRIPI